jgi:hypothetical protein|tara:strand:- start:170 stop:526 length:357 start_codon:yes stop_codon:yes gene_type:complete
MKLNITHKGKKIGEGYLPDIQTKPSENYIHKITQYETTINGFNDFEDQTDLFKAVYKEHRKSLNSTTKENQKKLPAKKTTKQPNKIVKESKKEPAKKVSKKITTSEKVLPWEDIVPPK